METNSPSSSNNQQSATSPSAAFVIQALKDLLPQTGLLDEIDDEEEEEAQKEEPVNGVQHEQQSDPARVQSVICGLRGIIRQVEDAEKEERRKKALDIVSWRKRRERRRHVYTVQLAASAVRMAAETEDDARGTAAKAVDVHESHLRRLNGVLLLLAEKTLAVEFVSANAEGVLGVPPHELASGSLLDFINQEVKTLNVSSSSS